MQFNSNEMKSKLYSNIINLINLISQSKFITKSKSKFKSKCRIQNQTPNSNSSYQLKHVKSIWPSRVLLWRCKKTPGVRWREGRVYTRTKKETNEPTLLYLYSKKKNRLTIEGNHGNPWWLIIALMKWYEMNGRWPSEIVKYNIYFICVVAIIKNNNKLNGSDRNELGETTTCHTYSSTWIK